MTDDVQDDKATPVTTPPFSRRALVRRAGLFGVGAVGLTLAGCKQRPEGDAVTTTEPTTNQLGGTFSGQISGLLTGAGAGGATIKLAGLTSFQTRQDGSFEVRIEQSGDFDIEIEHKDHHARRGRVRLAGNTTLAQSLLETDAGLQVGFLNQYARGRAAGKGAIPPRTPGATNRWNSAPTIRIYRSLPGGGKGSTVSDTRLAAMQASILGLFGTLTANRIGFPTIEIRPGIAPRSFSKFPNGTLVIAQTRGNQLESEHAGSVTDPWSITKARISCGVESTIELFNRMFAHALGGYLVTDQTTSILNAQGAAGASAEDALAATFLYSRSSGNRSPDRDRDGVFLNA